MRLLFTHGADPNIPSRDGVTPLLMASGSGTHGNDDVMAPAGRLAAVKYLVDALHADVNAADIAPPAPAPAPAPGTPAAGQPTPESAPAPAPAQHASQQPQQQ